MITVTNNTIVFTNGARFTVITPECIRMEFSPQQAFVDQPTLFARNRTAVYTAFTTGEEWPGHTIDTGRMKIWHLPDDLPFHHNSLRVIVRKGGATVE